MATVSKTEKVDFYALDHITQNYLVRATSRLVLRAMADKDLWAKVQKKKAQMYADGRLQREVSE